MSTADLLSLGGDHGRDSQVPKPESAKREVLKKPG